MSLLSGNSLELQENVLLPQPYNPDSQHKTDKSWSRNCNFSLSLKNVLLAPERPWRLPSGPELQPVSQLSLNITPDIQNPVLESLGGGGGRWCRGQRALLADHRQAQYQAGAGVFDSLRNGEPSHLREPLSLRRGAQGPWPAPQPAALAACSPFQGSPLPSSSLQPFPSGHTPHGQEADAMVGDLCFKPYRQPRSFKPQS